MFVLMYTMSIWAKAGSFSKVTSVTWVDPEGWGGGRGSRPPPSPSEKSQKYRASSNTGPDPQ